MYGKFTEDNKAKFNHMYSSVQWFTVLDNLISSAVDALLQRTTFVQEHISTLILYQLAYKKRGVSTKYDWSSSIDLMVQFIDDPTVENFNAINMDRGYSLGILYEFLNATNGYVKKVVNNFKFALTTDLSYYNKTTYSTSSDLWNTVQHISYCCEQIAELKKELLSYYILYIEKTANYDFNQAKFITDKEEIKQNYYLAFNKAVDHFNVSKGAFKSYLDIWITKYRNHHTNYYGTAFVVPSGSGIHSMSSELNLELISEDEEFSCSNSIDCVNNENMLNFYKQLALIVDPNRYTFGELGFNTEED